MLLFGGNTTKELPKTANDFYLLDTISMKWKKVNIHFKTATRVQLFKFFGTNGVGPLG